ncbi:MAG: glutathione synthase [bacterium]|nr:glutathione synthase [bacterium]
MRIAIVMDPLNLIHIDKDTTFALSLEAQNRGDEIFYIAPETLFVKDSQVYAFCLPVRFERADPCWNHPRPGQTECLDDFDYVLMRKDPPFDEQYFMLTHFLSLVKGARVANRAESLRNAPEKLYSLNFPGIYPPSLISMDPQEIRSFMEEQGGEIIIKPLNRAGGSGIIYLHDQDKNFNSLIELSTLEGKEFIIAQRYLPEVRRGDKRIILVGGEALGAVWRIPADHEHRGNIHVGGRVELAEITERDRWLISHFDKQLVADGLFFVGIDVIGDYITEINVTSPTGIQEILQLGGADIAKSFWDRIGDFPL